LTSLDDVQRVCDHVVMIDAGKLVVSGPTASLLERTGTVTVDVGPHNADLAAALTAAGLIAVAGEGVVEVSVDRDEQMDVVRDVIADRGLPLYKLTTRLTSLDDVFLRRAGEATS
jgi:ABC-2 type transport system ATP-binding protein